MNFEETENHQTNHNRVMNYAQSEDPTPSNDEEEQDQSVSMIERGLQNGFEITADTMDYIEYKDSEIPVNGMFHYSFINAIGTGVEENYTIAVLQAEADVPQVWDNKHAFPHVSDARLLLTRAEA